MTPINKHLISILLSMLILTVLPSFAEERTEQALDESELESIRPRHGLALLEATGSSLVLGGINRYVRHADYAYIDGDSIVRNFSSSWVWDQDEFVVNQIGHPYQGSFYYVAGRSNGLDFWRSSLLTAVSSAGWEWVMETETPSRNDLIATTLGGAALGEMLHRIYIEAEASGSPIRWIVSPLDGINDTPISDAERARRYPGFFPEGISLCSGIGYWDAAWDTRRGPDTLEQSVSAFLDGSLVYGDPFGLRSTIPYEQFEQRLRLDLSPRFYSIAFFSDGFLWAAPYDNGTPTHGTYGVSLHYDFIFSSFINFSANSIGPTLKFERRFLEDWYSSVKVHFNWVVLGASEYIHLRNGDAPPLHDGEERRNYDLGTGEGLKLYIDLSHPHIGTLLGNYTFYGLHAIPASVPEYGSPGYSIIGLVKLAIERETRLGLIFGVSSIAYHKRGFYKDAGDISEKIVNYNVYVKRCI
jgi:hypothetical protein